MNKNIGIVVGVVVIAIGSFYFGMKYGAGKNSIVAGAGRFTQTAGVGGIGGRGGRNGNSGFVSGTVIAKDETGVTLKLRDGGSKIVFLSGTTPVTKMVAGTSEDVAVGAEVSVTGTPNADGSVKAESVQIRPTIKTAE